VKCRKSKISFHSLKPFSLPDLEGMWIDPSSISGLSGTQSRSRRDWVWRWSAWLEIQAMDPKHTGN
jgi:hypothetical protein